MSSAILRCTPQYVGLCSSALLNVALRYLMLLLYPLERSCSTSGRTKRREGIEQPLGCDLEDTDADRRIADAFLRGYDGWDEAGEQGDESDAFDAGREAQERGDQEDNDQVMACIDFLKGCDPSNRLIDWHAFYNCPHNGGPWRNSSGMKHVVERV